MKNLICLLLFLSFSLTNAQQVDTQKSVVTFEVSNMAVRSVEGTFSGMTGEVILAAQDLEAAMINVCLATNSIDTKNEKRDAHLKNEDFFEVATYPKICFASNKISKSSDGYRATGTLKMHGVSKNIEVPFTFKNKVLEASFTVNRLDYGVGEGTNSFMVGKEIDVHIHCVLE